VFRLQFAVIICNKGLEVKNFSSIDSCTGPWHIFCFVHGIPMKEGFYMTKKKDKKQPKKEKTKKEKQTVAAQVEDNGFEEEDEEEYYEEDEEL